MLELPLKEEVDEDENGEADLRTVKVMLGKGGSRRNEGQNSSVCRCSSKAANEVKMPFVSKP